MAAKHQTAGQESAATGDESAQRAAGAGKLPSGFTPAGFLLVISGPSGAGKGTLVAGLVARRPECLYAISATTRPKRENEKNGVQYEFLSKEEFEKRRRAGYFLESAEVHGHLYGTPKGFVDEGTRAGRVVVLEVDVQGGASVKKAVPDAVTAFVWPPSIDALRQRLLKRATDPAEVVERRLKDAPGELAHHVNYDYLVMNDDLGPAVDRVVAIVDAERARMRRLKPQP